MAPLRIDPDGSFNLCEHGHLTTSVLLLCIVLSIFVVVKRYRARHNMPRIEQLTPSLAVGEKPFERDVFEGQDRLSELDRQLLMELLNPLLGAGPRQSSLMTSGYLAAKAKMARADKLASLDLAQQEDDVVESPTLNLQNHNNLNQRLQWSRRSSPGPRTTESTLQTTTDVHDESEQLIRFSTLHLASKHDEVRHFCDDYNPRIKWRRRTLIFDKTS